jgi:hypothetical protein
MRDDTRRKSDDLLLDPLLPIVREIAYLMLEGEVVNTEEVVSEGEAP